MKASILGADGNILCQIDAIREALKHYGHEHIADMNHPDSAFTFVGNPPFEKYLDFATSKEKKVIFNLLDLPFHVPELPEIVKNLKSQLPLADRVTCISKTTQKHLKDLCGIDSEVIYYPMKPVRKTGVVKYPQFKVALFGRLLDSNKYASVAISSLIKAGFNESEIAIVGPEFIGWGAALGVVSDEVLNDIYNSVDYVVMLDKNAGIGLPAIEAACCGAIPIVAPHLSTFDEFWADSPLGLNYQILNSSHQISELLMAIESNKTWKAELKQDFAGHGELFFRPKFDAKEVVKRIIDVYHSI